MPINRVVLNASPLIGLFKSGLVDLIPALFQDIVVPEAVIKERHYQFGSRVSGKTPKCWVLVIRNAY